MKEETAESWTRDSVTGDRYTGRPVYVLTSAATFGAAEELAYALQAQRRALVVGERSGGRANTSATLPVGGGFIAFLPTGRAVNPVTKTSWEGVGVKPDLAVPAPLAVRAAHLAALTVLVQGERDLDRRLSLQQVLAQLRRGSRTK